VDGAHEEKDLPAVLSAEVAEERLTPARVVGHRLTVVSY
jgi:hypothetical protein